MNQKEVKCTLVDARWNKACTCVVNNSVVYFSPPVYSSFPAFICSGTIVGESCRVAAAQAGTLLGCSCRRRCASSPAFCSSHEDGSGGKGSCQLCVKLGVINRCKKTFFFPPSFLPQGVGEERGVACISFCLGTGVNCKGRLSSGLCACISALNVSYCCSELCLSFTFDHLTHWSLPCHSWCSEPEQQRSPEEGCLTCGGSFSHCQCGFSTVLRSETLPLTFKGWSCTRLFKAGRFASLQSDMLQSYSTEKREVVSFGHAVFASRAQYSCVFYAEMKKGKDKFTENNNLLK